MDFRQLRHFVAIVDRGGFARAAAHCHVSQPTISASIAQLESRLGTALLERGGFGARPTGAGRILYDRARLILSEVARASDEMASIREGEAGSVAIGIGPLFEHMIMPTVLAEFVARRPKINVTATIGLTAELFGALTQGELDFAISSPPGSIHIPDGIDIELLQTTHDVVVAASNHPILLEGDFSLQALARWPWVVSARVNEVSQTFYKEFQEAGVAPPRTLVRTDSIPILRQLVLERRFFCVVSPHFIETVPHDRGHNSELTIVPAAHFTGSRQVCLSTRSGALLTKAAKELAALTRSTWHIVMPDNGKLPAVRDSCSRG